ncbi:MAG: hypothetical protein AB3N20_22790 [Rhizobiaceae bacterium]
MPWSERAIAAHVDQVNLRGELPAMVFEELRLRGEELFTARFTTADGVGRPLATQASIPTKRDAGGSMFDRAGGPDASSCAGCHNQPAIGGAGDFATNIFIAEAPGGESAPMPNPALANERGTTHIFGAGLIELLAREMTMDLHQIRENAVLKARETGKPVSLPLTTKGVDFGTIVASADGAFDTSGIEGVDPDLIIKPFGQKGVFVSLREFTVHVLNHHHGMQADERFGFAQTGELDFDGDGVSGEISPGDVSALVAWQAGLKPPSPGVPENEMWKTAAKAGSNHFDAFGCTSCHKRALPLESLKFSDPGPINAQGTLSQTAVPEPAIYDLALLEWASSLPRDENDKVLVPLFGDLKRHRIADEGGPLGNEKLPQRKVEPHMFMTAELWGLSATAPYGHRNDFTTIDEIVRAHGGEARVSRQAYVNAAPEDRDALIAYLRTFVLEGE